MGTEVNKTNSTFTLREVQAKIWRKVLGGGNSKCKALKWSQLGVYEGQKKGHCGCSALNVEESSRRRGWRSSRGQGWQGHSEDLFYSALVKVMWKC